MQDPKDSLAAQMERMRRIQEAAKQVGKPKEEEEGQTKTQAQSEE